MKSKEYKTYQVSYNIGNHDLEYRKKNINKHLEKGISVKISMSIRGRSVFLYKDPLEKLIGMFSEYKIVNAWGKENNYYLFISKIK
jgi:translation initiation factor IF-3